MAFAGEVVVAPMPTSQPNFRRSVYLIGAAHVLVIGAFIWWGLRDHETQKPDEAPTWLDPAAMAGAPDEPAPGAKGVRPVANEPLIEVLPDRPAAPPTPTPAQGAKGPPPTRLPEPESEIATRQATPTIAATPTPRPTPTPTPQPTRTPVPTPTIVVQATPHPTPTPTPHPTPHPTEKPTPKPAPKHTPKPTPKPTKKPKIAPARELTPPTDDEDEPEATPKKKVTTPKPKATPRATPTPKPLLADAPPKAAEPKSLETATDPEPNVKKGTRPDGNESESAEEIAVRAATRPNAGTPGAAGAAGPGGTARSGRGTSTTAKTAGGNKGADLGWYYSQIHERFYGQWNQPTSISTTERKLSAKLRIRIERDGTISSYEIARSSGLELMDESVLDAASRVKKIEPLPDSLAKSAPYTLSIDFELD